MPHQLSRLKNLIFSEPQLATLQCLEEVSDFFNNRETFKNQLEFLELRSKLQETHPEMFFGEPQVNKNLGFSKNGSIATININGALSQKTTAMEALCGARSYQSILQDVKQVESDQAVETVVFMIDSGGGSARGCFDTAKEIKSRLEGKKTLAFIDSMAASAAYALASVMDEVIVTSDASVGSIGVVLPMMNYQKAYEKAGVEFTPIFAGEHKVLGHPALELTSAQRDILQADVDKLFDGFVSHISANRSLTEEHIVGLKALTFVGEEAVSKGLADKVMTASEFENYLGGSMSIKDKENVETAQAAATKNQADLSVQADTALQEQLEAMQAEMAAKSAMAEELAEKLAAFEQKEIEAAEKAKEAKLADLTAKGKQLGLPEGFAALAMSADEGLVSMLTDALATAKEQLATSAAMEELGTSEEGVGELSGVDLMNQKLKEKFTK